MTNDNKFRNRIKLGTFRLAFQLNVPMNIFSNLKPAKVINVEDQSNI